MDDVFFEVFVQDIAACQEILLQYLSNKEVEVVTITVNFFDHEQIMKTYAKDLARETTKRIAMTMLRKGRISVEEIHVFFPELTLVDIEEIENEVSSSSQQTN